MFVFGFQVQPDTNMMDSFDALLEVVSVVVAFIVIAVPSYRTVQGELFI
jgi:hypothetical protein